MLLYETNLRTYSINQQAYIFAQDVNIDVISAVKERPAYRSLPSKPPPSVSTTL